MRLLHRHPAEVALPPKAYAELEALRGLRDPDLCPACKRELARQQADKICEQCGKHYQDKGLNWELPDAD